MRFIWLGRVAEKKERKKKPGSFNQDKIDGVYSSPASSQGGADYEKQTREGEARAPAKKKTKQKKNRSAGAATESPSLNF